MINKVFKFKLVKDLKAFTDAHEISYKILISISAFAHKISAR